MINLPCINCITLAICKSIYRNGCLPERKVDPNSIRFPHMGVDARKIDVKEKIVDRCTLLKKFLYDRDKIVSGVEALYIEYQKRRQKFFDYMENEEKIDG